MERTAQQVEDELLVLRCLAAEPGAMTDLVRRWRLPVLSHAGALLGGSDAEVDDVVQETWVAVIRGLPRLDDPARFRAWLFRIATNKCADCIGRRQQVRRNAEGQSTLTPASLDHAHTVAGIDEIDQLRAAISELDFDRQAMLRMFYVEEMSVHEIGDALAIPAGTVKSRLHHTRHRLRETLERHMKEQGHEQVH